MKHERPNRGTGVSGRSILIGLALLTLSLCGGCITPRKPFAIHEVAPGIYTGRKPWTQAAFNELHARGIRTILNLEEMPWDVWPEGRLAHRNGIEYWNIPILAAPLLPSEKRVKQALSIMNDTSLRPIFVHCFLGEDRSTFIIGLYRVYFEGWAPQAAWDEMLRSDFHVALRLRGLSSYFWRHTARPEWVKAARSPPRKEPTSSARVLGVKP